MLDAVIVIAKRPVAGRVKTRLTPPFAAADAARLAAASLADTLDAVDAAAPGERVLAFEGDPDGWVRPGWRCHPQGPGGLADRIAGAFAHVRGPAVLVGMDTPQLRADLLTAFDPSRFDACLGLCPDGGYWALGLRDPGCASAALAGVPMSTERTGAAQGQRLDRLGLRVQVLPELRDVDTAADAAAVSEAAPWTRFAREHVRLTARPAA